MVKRCARAINGVLCKYIARSVLAHAASSLTDESDKNILDWLRTRSG